MTSEPPPRGGRRLDPVSLYVEADPNDRPRGPAQPRGPPRGAALPYRRVPHHVRGCLRRLLLAEPHALEGDQRAALAADEKAGRGGQGAAWGNVARPAGSAESRPHRRGPRRAPRRL